MAKKQAAKSVAVIPSDHPAETHAQRMQLVLPQTDAKNKILATLPNMRALLTHQGVICRYNVIKKRIIHNIPNESFSSENEEESALACIYSFMKEAQLPVDGYKLYLTRISDENQYNPVLEWVRSKPWDGYSRLPELCATIESPEEEAKNLLIRRWLISAMHMALGEGIDGAGCLVLQGPQDLGKTWWTKKLVPESLRKELIRTDATVDPKDKDQVSQVISYWICELGEIGATFRKSDLDALKSFITRDHDTMRRPYGEGDKRYPRRTALIASVDQMIYLHDTAGNRRFWTIPCTKINSFHEIDMQQLWAEILYLIEEHKESWRLEPDEKEHIRRINEEHMQIDPIMEMIQEKYRWDELDMVADWKTATQIAEDIGLRNISVGETRKVSGHVRKLNGDRSRQCGAKRLLFIPALRGM
jgi:putative DNA primase/helicase